MRPRMRNDELPPLTRDDPANRETRESSSMTSDRVVDVHHLLSGVELPDQHCQDNHSKITSLWNHKIMILWIDAGYHKS